MHIVFYEKPGCSGNARQKTILGQAGHEVEARDLLHHPFGKAELRSFFGESPVADWFNRNAPKVKSGEVVPENFDAEQALELFLAEPIFIRRPLLQIGEAKHAGFDVGFIEAQVGAPLASPVLDRAREAKSNLEVCPSHEAGHSCSGN